MPITTEEEPEDIDDDAPSRVSVENKNKNASRQADVSFSPRSVLLTALLPTFLRLKFFHPFVA